MKNGVVIAGIVSGCLALSACTSVVPVKDVTSDTEGYLKRNFMPEMINPAVRAKLPGAKAAGFGRMTVIADGVSEGSDGKKETIHRITSYEDVGNGLFAYKHESQNNAIAYALNYGISYRGLLALRWQSVPLRQTNTGLIYEVKQLDQMTEAPSQAGKTFSATYKTGNSVQLAGYFDLQKACTAGRSYRAAEVNAKFAGQALELTCELRANNAVQDRSKWVLLESYGLAIELEGASASTKYTWTVVDVKL
jgi:hypothetical protein